MGKIGILLPTRGALFQNEGHAAWETISEMAVLCEASPVESVWVGDSLSAKPRFDPMTILGALAAKSERLRLGTSGLVPVLRNPAQLLQSINTVNAISDGRLIMGLGLGGAFNDAQKQEWSNVGINHRTRKRRFQEILEIIDLSKIENRLNYAGDYYNLTGLEVNQRADNDYTILVAAHARHELREQFERAGKFGDGFISITDTPIQFSQGCEWFTESHIREANSDSKSEKVMYITVNVSEDIDKAGKEAEDFLTAYYGANIWGDAWGPFGGAQRVIERIREYQISGATTVIVRFASLDQMNQLKHFIAEVLPNV